MSAASGRLGLLISLVLVVLAGCGQPAAQPGSPAGSAVPGQPQTSSSTPSRVVVAIGAEVTTLGSKFESANTYSSDFNFVLDAPLTVLDPKGTVLTRLAAEQPSREAGTWVVNPDGTMKTTWKIRPNAKWHDGQPVTSNDFVFALRVYMDDALPVPRRDPESFMDRVVPVDDTTFDIYWKGPYVRANALGNNELQALPEHILRPLYESRPGDQFLADPFWATTAYVSNGPYRIVNWEPGTTVTFRAFDDYVLGRPKIDEVIFRIIADGDTVAANLLGGAVDTTVGQTLGQQVGTNVRNQWRSTGEGEVVASPTRWRYIEIQHDPARNQQPALLDLRVRRALEHGIDRVTLADIVSDGSSPPSDVPIIPNDPLYPRVQAATAKYPYDQNRALALLQEAGWTRNGDTLVNATGQPFQLDIRTTQVPGNDLEMNIIASDLSKLGMQMTQNVVPQSRIRDLEYRVTFPGLNTTALSIDVPQTMQVLTSDLCPTVERRYAGGNRGCWKNPEYDEMIRIASTSLDQKEREDAVVRAATIVTENVGAIGTFNSGEYIAIRKGLVGPGVRWPGQSGSTWNIADWYWAS
jgi:peptide/nickel transport system substrate-binding protein